MATKNILVHLNLNGNEIQNVVAQRLASAPASAVAGQFYYNTQTNLLYVYNGSEWVNALSQGKIYTGGTGITISNTDVILVDFTKVVSTETTVNGKALSGNITLSYEDVDALPDTTTINDLTSAAQQAALNSGATTTNITQIGTNTTAISTINSKIPAQATSTNQLADKNFVNSSISTNTAYFDGTWGTYAAIPSTVAGFTSAGFPEPTNNNYLLVKEDETKDGGTWRYKYVDDGTAYAKSKWKVEYEVNETPLTAAQLAALNSGITAEAVAQIETNRQDIADLQTTDVTASSTTTFTNKTISADTNTISNLKTDNFKSGIVRTSVRASSSATNTNLVSEKAVATALESLPHKLTTTNPALTVSGGVCTWTITNTLGTPDCVASIREVATNSEVLCDITYNSANIVVKINSSANITANTYKATIIG